MNKISPEQLAELIELADKTPAGLAGEIGRGPDYIRDFIVGRKNSLKADDWSEIAEKLSLTREPNTATLVGLRVEGVVQAGNFRDVSLDLDNEFDRSIVNAPHDPRFKNVHQYALEVCGDSMDLEFLDGSFVTCVEWAATGLELKPGMILHVERSRAADLVETTVKEYQLVRGVSFLIPKSSNPKHKPIAVNNGDQSTNVVIKGLVFGSWKPTKF